MSNCFVCGRTFVPSKYTRGQKFCSVPCRHQARMVYKRGYDALWRARHPGYMKAYQKRYRGEAVSGLTG